MVHSVPTGQLVFSSRPVVRTVRYVIQLVNTSGQVGEYFVHRVRQFIWPSPSWRKERARTDFFNIITHGQFIFMHCYFVCRKIDASSIIIRQLKTAPARAFIFSGNVVGFQRATYASQYTTSQFRSAHAHARSRADLLRSTRITSTSLNMHVMLAYASELRGCSSVASTWLQMWLGEFKRMPVNNIWLSKNCTYTVLFSASCFLSKLT